MANIFLDANILFGVLRREPDQQLLYSLFDNGLYVSPLSFHIYCYLYKIKMPNDTLLSQMEEFQLIDLSQNILERALSGPTNDLEDNIQLHSAAEAECDIFLTHDKELFKLTFFGKMRIASRMSA